MNHDLISTGNGDILDLLHESGGGVSVPEPFSREIFLFDTYVAGTSYVEGIEELEPHLKVGDRITFIREPDNPYDSQAIRIENADGVKIGYVPRNDNPVFARLMDAGKLLVGRITHKKMDGRWLLIRIDIFLQD